MLPSRVAVPPGLGMEKKKVLTDSHGARGGKAENAAAAAGFEPGTDGT